MFAPTFGFSGVSESARSFPFCFSIGKGFAVSGKSASVLMCNPAAVTELWINADAFQFAPCLKGFTAVERLVVYSSGQKSFDNAIKSSIFVDRTLDGIDITPRSFTDVNKDMRSVTKLQSQVMFLEGNHVVASYDADAFASVRGSVQVENATFDDMTFNATTFHRVRFFCSKTVHFMNCEFSEDTVFPPLGNIAFKNCKSHFTAPAGSGVAGYMIFMGMALSDMENIVSNRFFNASHLAISGLDHIPNINFSGRLCITTKSLTFNASTGNTSQLSGISICAPRFQDMRLHAFDMPKGGIQNVHLHEYDSPHDRAILLQMSPMQFYRFYTGQIPLPTLIHFHSAKLKTLTFEGAHSVHANGFETSAISQYREMFDKTDKSFDQWEFLLRHRLPLPEFNVLKNQMPGIQKHIQAVAYRVSSLNDEQIGDWIQRLTEDVAEGAGQCPLGMANRLMNSMVGIVEGVEVPISMGEDLQNQLVLAKRKKTPKDELLKILLDRGHKEENVRVWLDAYDPDEDDDEE